MLPDSSQDVLNSSSVTTLLAAEAVLASQARAQGVEFKVSPPDLAQHLARLDAEALSFLTHNLNFFAQTLKLARDQGVDPWDDKQFFKLSMKALGLSYPTDFLSRVGAEDVVEAYDLKRRQIYRNMRFMEASSYSLLEILSNDWTTLFERSSEVTKLMIKYSEMILWEENQILKVEIPKHIIRELRSHHPQAVEIEHKYFAPLFSGPNKPGGALSVCQATILNPRLELARENVVFI